MTVLAVWDFFVVLENTLPSFGLSYTYSTKMQPRQLLLVSAVMVRFRQDGYPP